jgi:hypothetical protein
VSRLWGGVGDLITATTSWDFMTRIWGVLYRKKYRGLCASSRTTKLVLKLGSGSWDCDISRRVSVLSNCQGRCYSSLAWHSDAHVFTNVFRKNKYTSVRPQFNRATFARQSRFTTLAMFSGTSNPDPVSERLSVFFRHRLSLAWISTWYRHCPFATKTSLCQTLDSIG